MTTLVLLKPWWLLLLPCLLLPYWQRPAALTLSSLQPLATVPQSWRGRLYRGQKPLQSLTLLLLIVALANPEWQTRSETTTRTGRNLMLALDISASMRADDVAPNRMAVARDAAADFLARRHDDRIGVVLFSGVPYLLSPPVFDAEVVIARLRKVAADQTGSGTALGDAIAAAAGRLETHLPGDRAVVLLTDGTSNRGRLEPLTAARAAARLGIRVYTIGFGRQEGVLLPIVPGGHRQRVVLDEKPLQQIAELTGGRYFRAEDGNSLEAVYRQIDTLETAPLATRSHIDRRPLAPRLRQWSAALLLLEVLLYRLWLRRLP